MYIHVFNEKTITPSLIDTTDVNRHYRKNNHFLVIINN